MTNNVDELGLVYLRLTKMCINESYSKVRVRKRLSDALLIQNGMKEGDALSPFFFILAWCMTLGRSRGRSSE